MGMIVKTFVTVHGPLDRDSNGFCHYKSPSLRKDRFAILKCSIFEQILRGPLKMGTAAVSRRTICPYTSGKAW